MKKIFALILVLLMVFSLSSCGKTESETEQETGNVETESGETTEVEGVVGIANPWTDSSASAIAEAVGLYFAEPANATEVSYSYLETENLGQMNFTLDGTQWTARVKKTDEFEDISGMYTQWSDDSKEFAINLKVFGEWKTAEDEEGTVNCGMGYYDGYSFTLCCTTSSEVDMSAVASEVFANIANEK